jgi:hypothetical protein
MRWVQDHRRDADYLAGDTEGRTPIVAPSHRPIDLDEIVVRSEAKVASKHSDFARGHCAAET